MAVAAGCVAAALSLPRVRVATADLMLAAAAVCAWALLALVATAPDSGATLDRTNVVFAVAAGALAAVAFSVTLRTSIGRPAAA